ncbi:MAG: TDP-N-acetylfucosamine:lipid II N-acetylfucosaminyltransferase [Spirochaetes bacterium]|nr:TDP-N-acetylfucosamine:lipid II N-acetylfucosaminyltransferase [Spirochaetota bacterium]
MLKYLHIFSDSVYAVKYIEFVDLYFNMSEHAFIVQYNNSINFDNYYKKYKNCYITEKKLFYKDYENLFKDSKKIIFHQLNKPLLLIFILLRNSNIYKKIIWSIWGGDVYFYRYKNTSFKNFFIEFFRKIIIKKIKIVCAYLEEDFEVMKKHYISKARFLKAKYPNPIEFPPIKSEDFKLSKNADDKINILIGNSASVENNHIFLLKLLSKFKDERINIYSILSYGANLEYINEVIQFGKLIYDNKFSPILELMDFNNYLQFLQNIDICVFGHDRQQGLGNLELLIYLGKKAFVKKETTTFNYYSKIGVSIFKTEEITSQSFNAFISFKQNEKENNNNIIKNENDLNILKKQWEDVFNA